MLRGGEIDGPRTYDYMDPFGAIANMAAVGAVVGSAIALVEDKEDLAAHITWGSVAGGMLGLWQVLLKGLSF